MAAGPTPRRGTHIVSTLSPASLEARDEGWAQSADPYRESPEPPSRRTRGPSVDFRGRSRAPLHVAPVRSHQEASGWPREPLPHRPAQGVHQMGAPPGEAGEPRKRECATTRPAPECTASRSRECRHKAAAPVKPPSGTPGVELEAVSKFGGAPARRRAFDPLQHGRVQHLASARQMNPGRPG